MSPLEGIGIDIVSNERIRRLHEKFGERFYRKIMTEREISYCLNFSDPIPHIAGRFAAKEAVIKALGKPKGLSLNGIEILNNQRGVPEVFLKGERDKRVLITISHEKSHTVAFAIVLGEGFSQFSL